MLPTLTLTDTPDEQVYKVIWAKIMEFNIAGSGGPNNYRPLVVVISDPVTQEPLGGLWGWTAYTFMHVSLLYIPEEMRTSGLGRQIMKMAEEEALERECKAAWLDTFSFQARAFYEKLGFEVFGQIEDYPPGHSRYFLKKVFSVASKCCS